MEFDFPIYRKYPNDKNYFKIISIDEFEELQVYSHGFELRTHKAKILPDRNLIMDMLITQDYWEEISEHEYIEKLKYCENNLPKIN